MPLSDAKLIACLALNLLHFPHLDAIICLTNYRPEVFQLGPSPLYRGFTLKTHQMFFVHYAREF